MKIERNINDKVYEIELSEEELYTAYIKKHDEINIDKIFQYLDYCESVGQIPSELLKSERFADRALVQLMELESNYEENIISAVQMAVDYELKSNTVEDLVSASTADIIINKLTQADLQLDCDCANLQYVIKNRPDDLIRSIREAPAVNTATAVQRSALDSCVELVEKYKACTNVSRGINELGDHDDLSPLKEKDVYNAQAVEQQQSRSRKR